MLWMLITVAIVLAALLGLYLFCLLGRLLSFFPRLSPRIRTILRVGLTGILLLFCLLSGITVLLFLVYFELFSLLAELVYRGFRCVWKGKGLSFLYRSSLVPLVVTGLFFGYGLVNMQRVVDTTYTIRTGRLEEPLTIAYISDLHMGTTMDADTLAVHCASISQKGVDLVLLGGDMVDESTTYEEMRDMAAALSTIRSRYGMYAVLGNHDAAARSKGTVTAFSKEDMKEVYRQNGIRLLEDEGVTITDNLYLIGRADASFSGQQPRAALSQLIPPDRTDACIVLLDHQPLEWTAAAEQGVSLMLSGHTHSGQLWPVNWLMELLPIYERNYGQETIGRLEAIVSSGIGGWGSAIRTASHSEIVYIQLD